MRTNAVILSMSMAIIFTCSKGSAAPPFVHETVDATGNVGVWPSLAIDAHSNPHISYYDLTNADLKYAVKAGGNWVTETVDATGDVGGWSSLAIDAQGNPHISYYDLTNTDLKYAVKSDGSWTIESVYSTGDAGWFPSIEIDAQGNPHISFYENTNGFVLYVRKSGGSWTVVETVDAMGGLYTSLELDSQGNPHIAYQDGANDDLKYAVKTGGAIWSVETVDAVGLVGETASLGLDASGRPHISYRDASNGDLKYAVKLFASWTIETVDAVGDVGWYTSIAVDADGDPHISYLDNTNAVLKYAVKGSVIWAIQTADGTGQVGQQSFIALDDQGNPHISYKDYSDFFDGDLKYTSSAIRLTAPTGGETWVRDTQATVTWDGGGVIDILVSADGGATYVMLADDVTGGSRIVNVPNWATTEARVKIVRDAPFSTSESDAVFTIAPTRVSPWWTTTADAGGNVGSYTSLALSASGIPHVSYYDASNGDLKYTFKNGTSWPAETVDATGDVGEHTSLGFDAQGNPHISYFDNTNDDLKYAVKSGGSWTIETVDATGIVGSYTSLGLDAVGTPHISYYDDTNDDLKYAVRTGGTWTIETVDATGIVGSYTSLALDVVGNPHISYFDDTNNTLKYAVKTAGSWAIETADATGFPGQHTSIALDTQGNPHISYFDFVNADLKYAVKTGGIWSTETVDAKGFVGLYTSLELDAAGNPHISYTIGGAVLDLKYAAKGTAGSWTIETVDATGNLGQFSSLELDAQGNPHISYRDETNDDFRYASGAVSVANPSGGDVWPVGATRSVTWNGTGTVDISLSVDGGASHIPLAANISGGSYDLIVPHTPSKFALVRIERREDANDFGSFVYRHSISETDSFFTIETSVALLMLLVSPPSVGPGLVVSWNTDPGPADLSGYRLEKASNGGSYATLASHTTETTYHDVRGADGDSYRLFAINGYGDEFYLGEKSSGNTPSLPGGLAVYPLPFQRGDLTIEFATTILGGEVLPTEIAVYDVLGRKVRTVAQDRFAPPFHQVTWDGKDEHGVNVASGIYFVRSSTPIASRTRKLVIVR